MIGRFRCDGDGVRVWAENQEWDDKTIQQLRKEHNIFYDRSSHIAVMLYGFSKKHGGMVVFGFEDDGTIYFEKDDHLKFKHAFHSRVLPAVLKELQDAYSYMKARGYEA